MFIKLNFCSDFEHKVGQDFEVEVQARSEAGVWSVVYYFREVCRKSKWKFKMAFAMKGGGLEGVSFAIKLF